MAVKNKSIDDLIKLLNKLETEVPKKVAEEYKKNYYDFLQSAIDVFYNSYNPKIYDRTFNFACIGAGSSSSVTVNKSRIHVDIGFDYMDDYVRGSKSNSYYISAEYVGTNAFVEALHGPNFLNIKTTPTPLEVFVEKSEKFIQKTIKEEIEKQLKEVG